MPRQLWQRSLSGALENRQRIAIPSKPMRIHQTAHKLVEAVSRKTVLCVVFRCNRLRIQIVQTYSPFPQLRIASNCRHPRQGRNPLPKRRAWSQPRVVFPIVVVCPVLVPPTKIFSGRILPHHLSEGHQQTVVAEPHQYGAYVLHLTEMQRALKRHLSVIRLFKRPPDNRSEPHTLQRPTCEDSG